MASSTQFSIRGLMAITVAVAVVSASVAPLLRQLVSYERATLFVVNASTGRGLRPIRIRVAVKDRADWERIFVERGVPSAKSLAKDRHAPPTEPAG